MKYILRKKSVAMFVILIAFWFVLVGCFSYNYFIVGSVSLIFTVFFMYKLLKYSKAQYLVVSVNKKFFTFYIFWLIGQIILANFTVMIRLFKMSKNNDKIVKIDVGNMCHTAVTLLANSITITPGTVSLHYEKDCLYVHVLDSIMVDGLEEMKKNVVLCTK